MKIRTDSVPFQTRSYPSIRKSVTEDLNPSVSSLKQSSQSINIKYKIDNALVEALNVARLSINMALKAQNAVSGHRNIEGFDQKISEIFAEYRAVAPSISQKKQIFKDNNIKEIPSIDDDIARISAARKKPAQQQAAEFTYIESSLDLKIQSMQNSIDQIEKKIENLYPVNSKKNTSFYTELLTHTAMMIIKNANVALAMQGNISRDSINRLNV